MEYKERNKQFGGQHLWARGYFAASSENVTDTMIAEYIAHQNEQMLTKNDHFGISGL